MNRRNFIRVATPSAGGLMLAFHLPGCSKTKLPGNTGLPTEINAWLVIDPDNSVTVRVAKSEIRDIQRAMADRGGGDAQAYVDVHRQLQRGDPVVVPERG